MQQLDQFYEKTASLLSVEEDVVRQVMSFNHQSIKEKMNIYSSIEDSGLGAFKIRQNSCKKRLLKLQGMHQAYLKQQQTNAVLRKIESVLKEIEDINKKLNENQGNNKTST